MVVWLLLWSYPTELTLAMRAFTAVSRLATLSRTVATGLWLLFANLSLACFLCKIAMTSVGRLSFTAICALGRRFYWLKLIISPLLVFFYRCTAYYIGSFQFRLKNGSLTLLINWPDLESLVRFFALKLPCAASSGSARICDFTLCRFRPGGSWMVLYYCCIYALAAQSRLRAVEDLVCVWLCGSLLLL